MLSKLTALLQSKQATSGPLKTRKGRKPLAAIAIAAILLIAPLSIAVAGNGVDELIPDVEISDRAIEQVDASAASTELSAQSEEATEASGQSEATEDSSEPTTLSPADDSIVASGSTDPSNPSHPVRYTLYSSGLMVISGSGAMPDYTGSYNLNSVAGDQDRVISSAPWYEKRGQIKKLRVEQGVTRIGHFAFQCAWNLSSLDLPSSLKSIGYNGFSNTGPSSVILPEGLETAQAWSFGGMPNLKYISFPSTLKEIGWDLLDGSRNLRTIIFLSSQSPAPIGGTNFLKGPTSTCPPHSVLFAENPPEIRIYTPKNATGYINNMNDKYIGMGAVSWSAGNDISFSIDSSGAVVLEGPGKLSPVDGLCEVLGTSKVKIGSGITDLGNAFKDSTHIEEVTIPDRFSSIPTNLFEGASALTTATLPSGLTSIPANTFKGCSSLTTVNLPGNVTSIGAGAFEGATSLTSVSIPSNVTSIGANALNGCTGITELTIPAKVNSIDATALSGCSNIQKVTFEGTAPQVTGGSAQDLLAGSPNATLVVPADSGFTGTSSDWPTNRMYENNVPYYDENGARQTKDKARVLSADSLAAEGNVLSSGWYVLGGVTEVAQRIKVAANSDVCLILTASQLKALGGIEVPEGSSLTIYAQVENSDTEHAGSIVAGAEGGNAAIGGGVNGSAGTITIVGGKITATGSEGAVGIGAGKGSDGATVNISGGKVDATGGEGACGIGSGVASGAGTVKVTGGVVNATGTNAPGIGAAAHATGKLTIEVDGGNVIAEATGSNPVVLGSADNPNPNATEVIVSAPVVVETGDDPTRAALGCDAPTIAPGGVVLLVKDASPDKVVRDPANPGHITLHEHSVLITPGFERNGITTDGDVDIATTTVDGVEKSDVKLGEGASMTYTNPDGKKVTISVPTGGGTKEFVLEDPKKVTLPAGVTVSVGGVTIPAPSDGVLKQGEIKNVTSASNYLNARLDHDVAVIAQNSFEEIDLHKVSCGYTMLVNLSSTNIVNDATRETHMQAIADKLVEHKATAGAYLDLTLKYQVSTEASKGVRAGNTAKVPVKLDLPESLINTDATKTREYFIYRNHNGVVDKLPVTFDPATKTLSFETEKFSTYAVAYADTDVPQQSGGDNSGNNNNGGTQTGDQGGMQSGDKTNTTGDANKNNNSTQNGGDKNSNNDDQGKDGVATVLAKTYEALPQLLLAALVLGVISLAVAFRLRYTPTPAPAPRGKHARK